MGSMPMSTWKCSNTAKCNNFRLCASASPQGTIQEIVLITTSELKSRFYIIRKEIDQLRMKISHLESER